MRKYLLIASIALSVGSATAYAQSIPTAVMPASFIGAPCSSSPGVPPANHTYYVSPTGNDSNNGLSTASPFLTISRAFKKKFLKPGDLVLVEAGTYEESVDIQTAGSSGACITLMGMPGQPVPTVTWSNDNNATINIWAPYIRISGLAVTHPEPNFNAASTANTGNTAIDSWGALARDANKIWRPTVHHIQIDNTIAYGSGCGGISFENTDYMLAYGNTVYGNAFSDPDECSGISIYEPVNLDSNSGYHIFVIDNYSFANQNIQPAYGQTYTTDGNGIIIDDGRQTQATQPSPPQLPISAYTGATLILGNVVFGNGGRGIHIYESDNVDVINNVAYQNLNDTKLKNYPSCGGELNAAYAGAIRFESNIAVASANNLEVLAQSGAASDQASNFWANDIADVGVVSLGSANTGNAGAKALYGVNPGFLSASTNPSAANFALTPSSAAIGAGYVLNFAITDADGSTVPAGGVTNIGAFQ